MRFVYFYPRIPIYTTRGAIMFSDQDIKQISAHGLTIDEINNQIEKFKSGFPFMNIVKPAVSNDGIKIFDDSEIAKYTQIYDEYCKNHGIIKFVPASGAATRMFKDLFEFMNSGMHNKTSEYVINNIDKFAFWDDLKKYLPNKASDTDIIKCILTDSGLNYGNLPKALIPFHKYSDYARTPVEEHLSECAQYAISNNSANIHFTISPEHRAGFTALLNRILPQYESQYGIKYNVSLSEQNQSTDTIAVNPDNTIFRNSDNSLLFRPSGHGALIDNLNRIDSDLIFIKNIDNVTTKSLRNDTVKYKKLLGGVLVSVQSEIFNLLNKIDNKDIDIDTLHNFIINNIGIKIENKLTINEYRDILNRPLRVCGMVRNTGAPGGGPFWVRRKNGIIDLQIVESSQISPSDKHIMQESEYFNPVDLVCGTKDYTGKKFDLEKYIDNDTGFISEKSKDGKNLRAMERPGLWNGAMSHWNTIFVAVSPATFTPVKVVSDLISPAHFVK